MECREGFVIMWREGGFVDLRRLPSEDIVIASGLGEEGLLRELT